jgi:hypothetical protein
VQVLAGTLIILVVVVMVVGVALRLYSETVETPGRHQFVGATERQVEVQGPQQRGLIYLVVMGS